MTARYFKETPCEHGQRDGHWHSPGPNVGGPSDSTIWCPGGIRQELTIDYEAAFHIWQFGSDFDQETEAQFVRGIVDAALVVEPVDR